MQISIEVPVFNSSGLDLEVELLDSTVVLCLAFEELLHCFPQRLQQFRFPPAVLQGSGFFVASLTLVIFQFLKCGHAW